MRRLSEDQRAAISFTSPDLLARVAAKSKRGAQVFTYISEEGGPLPEQQLEPMAADSPPYVRPGKGGPSEIDIDMTIIIWIYNHF